MSRVVASAIDWSRLRAGSVVAITLHDLLVRCPLARPRMALFNADDNASDRRFVLDTRYDGTNRSSHGTTIDETIGPK
jgi:hypothetical protein